jgi:hypothetical protein
MWARKSAASPALLHTFLFMAAGHKAALESIQGVASPVVLKSSQDAIRLQGKAIRGLNELLQDPVTAAAELLYFVSLL